MLARRLFVACVLIVMGVACGTDDDAASSGEEFLPPVPEWLPQDADLRHPRILFHRNDVPAIRDRLTREPYLSLFQRVVDISGWADGIDPDEHERGAERRKANAAKCLAFMYAIDRTVVDGHAVPFPSPEERRALGDRARDLLLAMFTRSRLAVPPPIGGWDRDITTSEEIVMWAVAYDMLVGGGYEFDTAEEAIRENLTALTSELYRNYVDITSPGGIYPYLHTNNHRAKTASAIALAAIVLAEHEPDPDEDPQGFMDPANWLDYGLEQLDDVLGYHHMAPDGVYSEGPYYYRYAMQNVIPFARAWDRLARGRAREVDGVIIPSLWRHPRFQRSQRWMLDMTLPNMALAPLDDGYVGRAHTFGILPQDHPDAPAFHWAWARENTAHEPGWPHPYETNANIELAVDSIVIHDDAVDPAEPEGATTRFYMEGGHAVFRSDWSRDAVMAVVTGEHDTAYSFGRDRHGRAVIPDSHEHADPGSFLLNAYGERLIMDPGYLDFGRHYDVNQGEHHNIILSEGAGPVDCLAASVGWGLLGSDGPPPSYGNGMAYLSDTLDTDFLDAVRVTTSYGRHVKKRADIVRRFLFVNESYLVIADQVTAPNAPVRDYTWLLHGNGGGDTGGAFERTDTGAVWSQGAARVTAGVAFASGAAVFDTGLSTHEPGGRSPEGDVASGEHAVLEATARAGEVRSILLVYPSRIDEDAPNITEVTVPDGAGLKLTDPTRDRRTLAFHRTAGPDVVSIPADGEGFAAFETDGALGVLEVAVDGSLRSAYIEGGSLIRYGGRTYLDAETAGALGLSFGPERADWIFLNQDETVNVQNLPFLPVSADGACGLSTPGPSRPDTATVSLSHERRVSLRAAAGNARPAADPGLDRNVAVGETIVLDGSGSCDLDGDAILPRWELVAAPAGSAWALEESESFAPVLLADRPGTFRIRLTVTDSGGLESRTADVVITATEAQEPGRAFAGRERRRIRGAAVRRDRP
jgi:hypothetical protein